MSVPGILYNIGLGLIGSSLSDARGSGSVKQGGEDFEQLLKSLQSGDTSVAQQAISALQQVQAVGQGNAAPANQVRAELNTLGSALDSGSLASARGAFAKLQQDFQSASSSGAVYGSLDRAAEVLAMLQQLGASASSAATGAQALSQRFGETDLFKQGATSVTRSLTQDEVSRFLQDMRASSMLGMNSTSSSASIRAVV